MTVKSPNIICQVTAWQNLLGKIKTFTYIKMSIPTLLIFDIDATLLKPGIYIDSEGIRKGLYDDQLLTNLLINPNYQLALASFNHDTKNAGVPIGGRRLGRTILDLQHPSGDSRKNVEDEFIQAWSFSTLELMSKYGKNEHIRRIVDAYHQKYGQSPRVVALYDDNIENVYLASKNGIYSYWVTTGLTRKNINLFTAIGNRVQFSARENQLIKCTLLQVFSPYIHKNRQTANITSPLYTLYLPPNPENARNVYQEFLQQVRRCGISIHILESDLN